MKRITIMVIAIGYWLTANAQWTNDGPTMGWSSWNTFAINISEDIIGAQAEAMAANGLREAGYQYVNIDDGYFGGRRKSDGQLLIHPTRFPNGLKPLVERIHALGLKAGIYSDAGRNTCGNFWGGDTIAKDVGMLDYDEQDATFFFNTLDMDFLKVDFCGGTDWTNFDKTVLDEQERYTAISRAIAKTGKKTARFNVCRWDYPGTWVDGVATSWRTTHDIADEWGSVKDIIDQNLYMSAYSSPGHYNDMDMLEVGRSLTEEEDKTHFALWCIMNSPLLIGCDMTKLSDRTLSLLTNKELIALNQDPLFEQAYVAAYVNGCYVLVKDLQQKQGTTRAFAVYNPDEVEKNVEILFLSLDLNGEVMVRDLFEHRDLGAFRNTMSITVPAHATRIYKVTAEQRLERRMYEAECAYVSDYQELSNNQVAGTAVYVADPLCSGGHKVAWLGGKPENDLIWRNVHSDNGGRYILSVGLISTRNSHFCVEVNGEDVQTVCIEGKEGKREVRIPATLRQGVNTIRLHNDNNMMPDIDFLYVKPEHQGDYVFSYFDNTTEAAGLKLAVSNDGFHWKALNDNKPIMKPTVGRDRLLRDPSICKGPDGIYHMVWTTSWNDNIIGYASSRDLKHWSKQKAIPVMKDYPTVRNSWAPELFYDDTDDTYYIFWASTVPGSEQVSTTGSVSEDKYNHRIYCTTTKDFITFTPTQLYFNPDFNAIDAAIVRDPLNGELIMAVKNENLHPAEKNIRIARAHTMTEGFCTSVSAPIHGEEWCEGPSPLWVDGDLVIFYDKYRLHRYGASISHDHGHTWYDVSDCITMPEGMSHGTAFRK